LFDYLLENNNIVDIQRYNPAVLGIYHKEVLRKIQAGEQDWDTMVQPEVAALIREHKYFVTGGTATEV
jgi:hypothetical protein